MLLRVRGPGGTHKIRCEPSTPYAELIALAESACGWSGPPGSLRLSLNKKDPLDLELGAAVENRVERGFPGLRAAALPAAPRPPVLAGALPFADGAPGAATAAARPLLRWGPSRPQLRPASF